MYRDCFHLLRAVATEKGTLCTGIIMRQLHYQIQHLCKLVRHQCKLALISISKVLASAGAKTTDVACLKSV